jgi:hypothetical protein
MKTAVLLMAFALGGVAYAGVPASSSRGSLSCTLGPLSRTFGGSAWRVYGCSDGQSVVVVTAPGNPAAPFYFLLARGATGLVLHGEGIGNKAATDAAFKELEALSPADVATLFRQASASAGGRAR